MALRGRLAAVLAEIADADREVLLLVAWARAVAKGTVVVERIATAIVDEPGET